MSCLLASSSEEEEKHSDDEANKHDIYHALYPRTLLPIVNADYNAIMTENLRHRLPIFLGSMVLLTIFGTGHYIITINRHRCELMPIGKIQHIANRFLQCIHVTHITGEHANRYYGYYHHSHKYKDRWETKTCPASSLLCGFWRR